MINTIIGLDLAATLNKPKVGLSIIKNKGQNYLLSEVYVLRTTKEILLNIEKCEPPILLAIDAPLKLPIPDVFTEKMINDIEHEWGKVYTFRPYEDLIFNKKSKFKASGRTFSSLAITYRAQILRIILEMRGWRLIASPDEVIDKRHNYFTEVFPHLTLNILGIKLGKKRVRYKQKQEFVKDLFKKKIYGIYFKRKNDLKDLSDKEEDVLDAIICGWTGVLFLLKKTICFGDKKYGFVICPYTKEFEEFLKINAKEKPYFYEIFSPEAY